VAPPGRHGSLRVVSFTGREAISELFCLDILLATASPQEQPPEELEEELLGQAAYLKMQAPGGGSAHLVHGIVASFALEGSAPELGRACVRVKLVPRLWLATQRRRRRIFQDMTVQEVVDAVLTEWKVPRQWRLMEKYAPRAYCTQYDETDHEFISRLLAEEGISYRFEPPTQLSDDAVGPDDRSEVMVLGDDDRLYGTSAGTRAGLHPRGAPRWSSTRRRAGLRPTRTRSPSSR
jgi:type VI secretion system secreted protein VgrG